MLRVFGYVFLLIVVGSVCERGVFVLCDSVVILFVVVFFLWYWFVMWFCLSCDVVYVCCKDYLIVVR